MEELHRDIAIKLHYKMHTLCPLHFIRVHRVLIPNTGGLIHCLHRIFALFSFVFFAVISMFKISDCNHSANSHHLNQNNKPFALCSAFKNGQSTFNDTMSVHKDEAIKTLNAFTHCLGDRRCRCHFPRYFVSEKSVGISMKKDMESAVRSQSVNEIGMRSEIEIKRLIELTDRYCVHCDAMYSATTLLLVF